MQYLTWFLTSQNGQKVIHWGTQRRGRISDFCLHKHAQSASSLPYTEWGGYKWNEVATCPCTATLSNCWIGIWIVFNHRPENCYKKLHVLPAFFIRGPNKPKNCNSYLYPSLHHLAALQKEGLHVWDASSSHAFVSALILTLATADGPGVVYLNGLIGHHGKNACRLYCDVIGHHTRGCSLLPRFAEARQLWSWRLWPQWYWPLWYCSLFLGEIHR